jgi:acetylornithine/succinyldiaminopimelate/putrescine aminotransferase
VTGAEFPGFRLPGSPVFNGARGTSMFWGEVSDLHSVLDLAMVFGTRLWGHDLPTLDPTDLGAPGVGDLYSHGLRARACEALCERVARELHEDPAGWRSLVLHTGSEAVETAIKTALRATGRRMLLAYDGGYHGTFGLALAVTHGEGFRGPWADQYGGTVRWANWGMVPALDQRLAAVVVEPWQGRAGVIPPPRNFLELLREECDRIGALLILDAVLCGGGRTGPTIAEAIELARPDIVCLGKAIGGGLTASAVVARTDVATAAWEQGAVEPAHTSTSIGEPIASWGILRSLHLLDARADELVAAGTAWRRTLTAVAEVTGLQLRGTGLLWALDTDREGGGVELARRLFDEQRILVVPSGRDGASITLYPAATCTDLERERVARALVSICR